MELVKVMNDGKYTIRVDGVPMSQNDRPNVFKKAADNRLFRRQAAEAAKAEGIPYFARARISTTIYRKRLGLSDEDNDRGRCKPIIDGLVDAGVLSNDSRKEVVYGRCREEKGTPSVEVTIEAAAPCTKCGRDDEEVESFLYLQLCLDCYALMAEAFMSQLDYRHIECWLKGGHTG